MSGLTMVGRYNMTKLTNITGTSLYDLMSTGNAIDSCCSRDIEFGTPKSVFGKFYHWIVGCICNYLWFRY